MNNRKQDRQIYISAPATGDAPILLSGNWTIYNVPSIEDNLKRFEAARTTPIDARGITRMDTAGAWLFERYFSESANVVLNDDQSTLLTFLKTQKDRTGSPVPHPRHSSIAGFLIGIGKLAIGTAHFCYIFTAFAGQIAAHMAANLLRPRHFRFPSIIRHIDETGVRALPIVVTLGFLISMVVAYQGALQLQKFGADIFTVDLTVISLLREMGVLVTAIMVAGRSGSAFAAEIGVMKLRGEIDALQTMGMNPVEVLVIPRILALIVTVPLLTFVANMAGLLGGGFMTYFLLDIPWHQYITRVDKVANFSMFFVGMIKAPVFAFLIAAIGTFQGMSATGSAESVGKMTTVSVVQSIFLVILADAVFSIIFAKLGI